MTLEALIDELTVMPPGAQLEELRDGVYIPLNLTVNAALAKLLADPPEAVYYRDVVMRPESGTVCLIPL